jgi:aromatic ring-opening dioxygenase catalytic subunit (LigB family)
MAVRQPVFFIPHGGGPCFFMPPRPGTPADLWDRMAAFLRGIMATLPERPKAILVISGHWEEPVPTVNSAAHPGLRFDYYGFPPHTYELTYPVPGDPDLAARVRGLLGNAGFGTAEDDQRGLDHGVFIPFKLVVPEADIPLVQLSLITGMDPAKHGTMGRALMALRDEGVLIVGSGMSYHNLRLAFIDHPAANAASMAFDGWMVEAVTDVDPAARDAKLARWAEAPGGRECHPREEHLIPLMVAAGAGDADRGQHVYADVLMGKAYSGFRFG